MSKEKYKMCIKCKKRLSLAERAFHENICSRCNHANNARAFEILKPLLQKQQF